MKGKAAIVFDKIDQMKDDRQDWEAGWKVIAENVAPWRENEIKRLDPGKGLPGAEIYDGGPIVAINTWTDGFYGHVCSRASKWFDIVVADERLARDTANGRWADVATLGGFRRFNNSNFYSSVSQFINDCGIFGISHMLVKDIANEGISYKALSPIRVYCEQDENDKYCLHVVETKLSNLQAMQIFTKMKGEIPRFLEREYEKHPFTRHMYYHVIGQKKMFEDFMEIETPHDTFSMYIAEDDPRTLISEGGYDMYPIVTWPYLEYSGSPYSYGPAHNAIYDILGIHQMSKTLLQSAQLASDPPIAAPGELKKKLRYRPHGITWYEDPSRRPFPILNQSQYPVGKDYKDDKMRIINKHFLVDFFELLQNLTARMTAYEVSERLAEKVAIIGPRVGQFTQMGLRKIIEYTINTEIAHRRVPPPPEILRKNGELVDVDFLGSLAQAQKKLALGQGLARAMQEILPLAQIRPEVLDNIDLDEQTRLIWEINGAPARVMKSDKQVKEERAQRAKMAAQQQQAEMLEKLGNANKGLSVPMNENSIAAQMEEG